MENRGKASALSSTPSADWVTSNCYTREELNPGISIHTLELQQHMNSLTPSLELLSDENKRQWRNSIRTGDNYGRQIINMLRQNGAQGLE